MSKSKSPVSSDTPTSSVKIRVGKHVLCFPLTEVEHAELLSLAELLSAQPRMRFAKVTPTYLARKILLDGIEQMRKSFEPEESSE